MGRVLRTTLPTGKGGVVHLLLFMVIRERRRMWISFLLPICFFRRFLLKLRPMLIAGDLNADRAVIPCLAQGFSAGRYVDLALAYSRGELVSGFLCRLS